MDIDPDIHIQSGELIDINAMTSAESDELITTMLGIPPPDQDTPVNEIIHQVEGVLEALTEERDKNAQKLGESLRSKLDSSPDRSRALRAPEVDAALEHFDLPKARIAHRLINKVSNENRSAQRPISSLAS